MQQCIALAHPSWQPLLQQGIRQLPPDYLDFLSQDVNYLPTQNQLFRAFSRPLSKTQFILFGESPYPRAESANGFAFWDAAVGNIWSEQGLSKPVNRATSLRNFIKMLCIADNRLNQQNCTPEHIAHIDKTQLVQTNTELFENLLDQGFLLLNASLVLRPNSPNSPKKDLQYWHPFLKEILHALHQKQNHIRYLLFGRLAKTLKPILPLDAKLALECEHPYNLSFISNPEVLRFFKPFHLLKKTK